MYCPLKVNASTPSRDLSVQEEIKHIYTKNWIQVYKTKNKSGGGVVRACLVKMDIDPTAGVKRVKARIDIRIEKEIISVPVSV